MVKIVKHYVSDKTVDAVTYGTGNKKKYITVHETDNTKATANAEAHGNLQANGNSRAASWHYTVDDKQAVQSFRHGIRCWAAGTDKGNNESIQVEICVNSDGNYKKAVENAADLVAHIAKAEGIPLANVVQHNYWSGKNCPSKMRSGKAAYTWSTFKHLVKAHMEVGAKPEVTKVSNPKKKVVKKKQIVTLVPDLNYYSAPRWTKPAGTVKKGTVLTVERKVKVDGAYQWETVSGTYITASEKYTKLL